MKDVMLELSIFRGVKIVSDMDLITTRGESYCMSVFLFCSLLCCNRNGQGLFFFSLFSCMIYI